MASLSSILGRFSRLPRAVIVAVGLLVVAAVALLDWAISPNVLLPIVYLLPVMLVAWATSSTVCGLLITGATCLVGPLGALLSGFAHTSLAAILWNSGVRLAVFGVVLLLMARVRTLMATLEERARLDELTGLANRRALRETLAQEIARSRRFRHPLSIAYIDIDGFKHINDQFGHPAGDRVLSAFADVARVTVRIVDTIARVGGDEFVILFPETDATPALLIADRLREAFSQATALKGTRITCSIGVAAFECPTTAAEEMLAAADELMYAAKAAGGDDVRVSEVPEVETRDPSRREHLVCA